MIARSCGMEAEGKAWAENPAMYGHLSMWVDFIVSAKIHCQFPVYVLCDRGPYGGGQLCATVLREKKKNQLKAGTPSTEPCAPSLPVFVPSQVAVYFPPLESSPRSLTPLQKLPSVMFQSQSKKYLLQRGLRFGVQTQQPFVKMLLLQHNHSVASLNESFVLKSSRSTNLVRHQRIA